MSILFDYLGAFDCTCTLDATEFFELYATRRMFTAYLCLQTLLTRSWALSQTHYVLALADGESFHDWAHASRLTWCLTSFGVTLVLDAGAVLWMHYAPDGCTSSDQDSRQRTISGLCRHSLDIGMGVRLVHVVNAVLSGVLAGLVTVWWLQVGRFQGVGNHKDKRV